MARIAVIGALIAVSYAQPSAVQAQPAGCPDSIVLTFGDDYATRACAIAACETGGTFDNSLIGRAGEVSMFQIHPIHFWKYSRQRLRDDEWYAAEVAFEMSNGGRNWSPWTCRY